MNRRVLCNFTGRDSWKWVSIAMTSVAAALTAASTAWADVTAYGVSRTISDTQESNAQPTTPEFWDFRAYLIYDVPNEVLSSSVSFDRPPVLSYDLYQAIATFHQYVSPFYTSDAAFLIDYPATTYTLTADRGAGLESGDVFLPEDLYCAATPYFTGDTYDRLQSFDVSQAFTVDFNGFIPNPGTNVASSYLSVVEDNVPGAIISVVLDPSQTSYEIPAATLTPGASYSIGLSYLNVLETPNAGFGGNATSGAEFWRSTTAYFTTLTDTSPCCRGDFNDDNQFTTLDIQGFVDALIAEETCP